MNITHDLISVIAKSYGLFYLIAHLRLLAVAGQTLRQGREQYSG